MSNEKSKAEHVREYLKAHPDAAAKEIVDFFTEKSISLTPVYIRVIKSKMRKKDAIKESQDPQQKRNKAGSKKSIAKYPRHSLEKSLRIPKGILEQNAGKECTEKQSATFIGVKFNRGPYTSELSSSIKFGLLERPQTGYVSLTPLAKQILRPQNPDDELKGLRKAVLNAPNISSVYEHYRGENLPDKHFFHNTLLDTFKIPKENISDFTSIFIETLKFAKLLEDRGDKHRILDTTTEQSDPGLSEKRLKSISKDVKVSGDDALCQPARRLLFNYLQTCN